MQANKGDPIDGPHNAQLLVKMCALNTMRVFMYSVQLQRDVTFIDVDKWEVSDLPEWRQTIDPPHIPLSVQRDSLLMFCAPFNST